MKPTAEQLAQMLARTTAALETPGDLTEDDLEDLKVDAGQLLEQWEAQ